MTTREPNIQNVAYAPLSFWAIGDLHYRAIPAWNEFHTRRLAPMFDDLHALWQLEGRPAFCVSPGDLIETSENANYQLARTSLLQQMAEVPFYPGVGNHEYFSPLEEDLALIRTRFQAVWGYPLRYHWQVGDFTCIMLDYPDPSTLADPKYVYISQTTLTFLDETLAANALRPAIVFLHCPLRDTVLSRNPAERSDYTSTGYFFSPENSQEIRTILARHQNVSLFLSGHTHSGWETPGLVKTEQLGDHPVTFVNLMSPWYTGTHTNIHMNQDSQSLSYHPDNPDVVPSFAIHLADHQATIRVREHLSKRWLKEWIVPIMGS